MKNKKLYWKFAILMIAIIILVSTITFASNKLFDLVENSSTSEIKKFIDKNEVNVNIRNKYGQTPLIVATENNNLGAVKILVENDANLNVIDNNYYSPLMISYLKNNNEKIAGYLIENGATDFLDGDISKDTLRGMTNLLRNKFVIEESMKFLNYLQPGTLNYAQEIFRDRLYTYNSFFHMTYSFEPKIEENLNLLINQLDRFGLIEYELLELYRMQSDNRANPEVLTGIRERMQEYNRLRSSIINTVNKLYINLNN